MPYYPYEGPDYQGFVFYLVSSDGKPTHILTITLQIDGGPGAGICGTWRSQENPGSLKPIEGVIAPLGSSIECQFTTTSGGTNILTGTLTYYPGGYTRNTGLVWPTAFLKGEVTDPDGKLAGPGHVSGTGSPQPTVAP